MSENPKMVPFGFVFNVSNDGSFDGDGVFGLGLGVMPGDGLAGLGLDVGLNGETGLGLNGDSRLGRMGDGELGEPTLLTATLFVNPDGLADDLNALPGLFSDVLGLDDRLVIEDDLETMIWRDWMLDLENGDLLERLLRFDMVERLRIIPLGLGSLLP